MISFDLMSRFKAKISSLTNIKAVGTVFGWGGAKPRNIFISHFHITRKGSKEKVSERYLTLHIIRHRP